MLISFRKVKRLAIISAIIIIPFICINLLNISLNKDSQEVNQTIEKYEPLDQAVNQKINEQLNEGVGFFSEYRLERERIRGQQTELLKNIAGNPSNDKKVRDAAAMKLVEAADKVEKEMQAETLIKSKGVRDCAVIIEQVGVSIIVDIKELSEEQKADIIKLSSRATGFKEDKITINTRQHYR